jgi:hypothetical protein
MPVGILTDNAGNAGAFDPGPPGPTILEIEVSNWVHYIEDSTNFAAFATVPGVTTASGPKNFGFRLGIADIVAINGQPVKGTLTRNTRNVTLRIAPMPGQAIADIQRAGLVLDSFDILRTDGTPIGTIVGYGPASGAPPPGEPSPLKLQSDFAIIGGTGAFLGARGQFGMLPNTSNRPASITEDPANRRINGGTSTTLVLQLIPMYVPQILATFVSQDAAQNDEPPLTSLNLESFVPGELVALYMKGLGPTEPGVDPGSPFPPSPHLAVIAPVQVKVNRQSVTASEAFGVPGKVDRYAVFFQVPLDTPTGAPTIQVTCAWITGPATTINVVPG